MADGDTYYCPKCGKKKLIAQRSWSSGGYFRWWKCMFNQPGRTWRSKKPDGPPCELEIRVEGRDAEIDDWDSVLGKLAQINVPQVQQWLLKHDRDVHKRGLEVLYEGTIVDLVRRRDARGVGVALYWRADTWDTDEDVINPMSSDYDALRTESAQYIDFKGFNVQYLFAENGQTIWSPNEEPETAVFKGKSVGKRLGKKLVEFTKALEVSIAGLLKKATSEQARWNSEQVAFKAALEGICDRRLVSLSHYNGNDGTGQIAVGMATPQQVVEINRQLGKSIKLSVEIGTFSKRLEPEKVVELTAILGKTPTYNISTIFAGSWRSPAERLTLDQAKTLARIMSS